MKKKKKKKQRDSLAVRLVSLSFSLVDSNFFIFVCVVSYATSERAMVAEKWKRGGVLKCSERAAKVFNINVFGQFSFMTKAYIYMYGSLSFAHPISLSSSLTFLSRGALAALPARTLSLSLHLHAYTRTLPLLSFLSLSLSLSLSSQFSYSIYCFR